MEWKEKIMKSLIAITQILPVLSSVQQKGSFCHDAPEIAQNWALSLKAASQEDQIDIDAVISLVEGISTAQDFEAQQDFMFDAIKTMDQLLEDIPLGLVPLKKADDEAFSEVKSRLTKSIANMIDIFRPDYEKLEAMRRDAANVATGIAAEDGATEEDIKIAGKVYDHIERSVIADPYQRRTHLIQAQQEIRKIAV